jgi:hypothetical protein
MVTVKKPAIAARDKRLIEIETIKLQHRFTHTLVKLVVSPSRSKGRIMSDYFDLKENVTALDIQIEIRTQRIRGLMEALKSIRTLSGETALLQELTIEIVALRELRQTSFIRKALLREHENRTDTVLEKGKMSAAVIH